mmetsp:Transcript_21301/g.63643  ORF Transcript_21301/g.63643 Transcript_21301/m.63643 type:complete len:960 (-) Transcript_21301:913-3792(-)
MDTNVDEDQWRGRSPENLSTIWRNTIFQAVAQVAVGAVDPRTVAKITGIAVATFRHPRLPTETIADAVWSHDVQISATKLQPMQQSLVALVQALEAEGSIPLDSLKRLLDEEILEVASLTNPAVFLKRMKKLNTDQVYRQRKYNLLHEETEGYSKVAALLSRLPRRTSLMNTAQMLRALIGGFDLDPNRVLDLILDSLEFHCNGALETVSGYLYLAHQLNRASLTPILGFKFQQYDGSLTPISLCQLAAILLGTGAISVKALLPHVVSSLENLANFTKKHVSMTDESTRSLGIVSLASSVSKARPNVTFLHDGEEVAGSQLYGVVEALLWDRRWDVVQPLLGCLEGIGAMPISDAGCRCALISLAHCTIDAMYAVVSPRLLCLSGLLAQKIKLPSEEFALQRSDITDLALMPRFIANLEKLCCHVHVYVACDVLLMTKLARIVKNLLETKEADTESTSMTAKRLLEHVLLPAVPMLPANPGCIFEIWTATKGLSYRGRHLLYTTWRGRGVEQTSIGIKNFDVALAECKAGFGARQTLKRVANEKKNLKHVGRALAKIAHSNPLVVFNTILSQIESYDNMIQPIIESLGFMTPFALDVLSHALQLHLADTSRQRLQNDGFNVARWFQHLASFTGVFYRAFPQAELGYLLEFLLARLEAGSSLELLVFSELLARMGGCQVLEDLSDNQISSLSGGETLRHEILAFDKASKRAVLKLQCALCDSNIAVPLLALIAQQREFALFKGQMNHVKLLGQLFDRCQLVFAQLVKFLSRTMEQTLSYLALLPNLRSLCVAMHFETQSALHASRPLMALAAKHRHQLLSSSSLFDLDDISRDKICAWDPNAASMKAAVTSSLPGCAWEAISCELYLAFWCLSLYDIEVPTKTYEMRISFLRARHGAAMRDLQDPDKRKKEMSRCLLVVDALKAELSVQQDHCCHILSDLEAKRISFLSAVAKLSALIQN